jgi:phosphatidylserine/phosphatidylglycerophosphate/cardiolipin synthase-like enzyme
MEIRNAGKGAEIQRGSNRDHANFKQPARNPRAAAAEETGVIHFLRPPSRLAALVPALGAIGWLAFAVAGTSCAPPSFDTSGAAGNGSGLPVELRVQPDDGPPPIATLIRAATRTVALEIYLLTDDQVIAALVDAATAGRAVTVVIEPHPFGAETANRGAHDRLQAAGVDVVWSSARFALTHTKLLVVDGQEAVLMTCNLTHAGLTTNREFAVVDQAPADVAAAQAMIAADRNDTATAAPGGRLLSAPENARASLLALIDGAQSQLDVEMEELSDAGVVAALANATAAGVALTVVAPAADQSSATKSALARLVAAGVRVRTVGAPAVHAKAIVADHRRLYVGSVNLTAASMDHNREVGIIVDDSTAAARVSATIAADAAAGAPP